MTALMLEFPIDAMALPGVSPESLASEAKFMLALKLFEVGRLSSGKAGKLCGMGRVEFLLVAGRAGVPVVALDDDELSLEFAAVNAARDARSSVDDPGIIDSRSQSNRGVAWTRSNSFTDTD